MPITFTSLVDPINSIIAESSPSPSASADMPVNGIIQKKTRIHRALNKCSDLFRRGRENSAVPLLSQYRSQRPTAMTFTAELRHGKVMIKGSAAGQEMADKLNQLPKQFRQDRGFVGKDQGLRLVDEKLSVFHIQSTPAVAATFKSSRTLAAHPVVLANPGRAHLGQVSGVQTTREGRQFRLIEEQLYRFEPQSLSWIADKDSQKYSRIGLTNEGGLMKVPLGVLDRSVEGNTEVSLEQSAEEVSFRIYSSQGTTSMRFTPIGESGEPVKLSHIGLAGDVLFATNSWGELLQADFPPAQGDPLKMLRVPVDKLGLWSQEAVLFKGFMHDDEGQLNALLLDDDQQLHSSPLTSVGGLLPGWNLSDVMGKSIDTGVPVPSLRGLASTVDLGQRGKVALDGGILLVWDASAKRFEATDQVGVDHLERGLDGMAYVLQAGQLKGLATTRDSQQVYMGASYDLAPPNAPRTQLKLDEVMAGNAQRVITSFAVKNGRDFVTLDKNNRLHAHIDGKERALSFPNPQKNVQSLALDHLGNLYAQTRQGELLRLDNTDWQSFASNEVAWAVVPLPGDERLKSLRMGENNQVIASWGENTPQINRWGEKYNQLNISDQGDIHWTLIEPSSRKSRQPLSSLLGSGDKAGYFRGVRGTLTAEILGNKVGGHDQGIGLLKGLKAHFTPVEDIKNIGLGFQHHIKGREGLEVLYSDDKALRGHLSALASTKPATLDMMTRLERMSVRESTQTVVSDLKKALTLVEDSSKSSATKLGDLSGLKVIPELPATGVSRDNKLSGSILSQIRQAFDNLSPSTPSPTADLLRSYEAQGLELSKWVPDQKRNLKSPSALIESDLIHHAQTLSLLTQLIMKLEADTPNPVEIATSLQGVMKGYHENQVHKKVSQNINSFEQAETLYNTFKLLSQDLSTPGSALNAHITRTLGLTEEGSLKQVLMQAFQQSSSGQSITTHRDKSINFGLSSWDIPYLPSPVDVSVGISKAMANAVTISRSDAGANIEFKTNASRGVSAALGAGVSLFPVSGNPSAVLRVGGELAGTVAQERGTSVSCAVKEADFSKMMNILAGQGGDVFDLLDLGTEHTSNFSSKTSGDLSIAGFVQERGQFHVLEGSGGLGSLLRMGAGIGANLNVIHVDGGHAETQGQNQMTKTQGSNVQMLNKGGSSVGVLPMGAVTTARAEPEGVTLGAFSMNDISFSVRFDKSVSHAFSFSFKQQPPVGQEELSELHDCLARSSAPLKRGLQALPQESAGIGEQLQRLQNVFNKSPLPAPGTEARHRLNLQLQSLAHQHHLVSEGKRALVSVENTVSYVGLNGDGQFAWMDDAAPANKTAILKLLKSQPQLALMIKGLESNQGTSVSIGLEVKPNVLRMIESTVADGRDARNDAERALKNKDNLRIKNLSVSYQSSRTQNIKIPLPVVSFTSSAGLSHTTTVLNTEFEYGADQNVPRLMKFTNALSTPESKDVDLEIQEQTTRDVDRPVY